MHTQGLQCRGLGTNLNAEQFFFFRTWNLCAGTHGIPSDWRCGTVLYMAEQDGDCQMIRNSLKHEEGSGKRNGLVLRRLIDISA